MSGLERLRAHQAEAMAELDEVNALGRELVDTALLEKCLARSAALLNGDRPVEDAADEKERAYFDYTDQFTFSVGSVRDEQVHALLEHSSADEVYAFAFAFYAGEMSQRLDMVCSAVLR
jgi:hypothetical protein